VTNTLARGGRAFAPRHRGDLVPQIFGFDRERALAKLASMPRSASRLPPNGAPAVRHVRAPHGVTAHPDVIRAAVAAARRHGHAHDGPPRRAPRRADFSHDRVRPFADLACACTFPSSAFPCRTKARWTLARDLGLLSFDVLLVHLTDAARRAPRIADAGAPSSSVPDRTSSSK